MLIKPSYLTSQLASLKLQYLIESNIEWHVFMPWPLSDSDWLWIGPTRLCILQWMMAGCLYQSPSSGIVVLWVFHQTSEHARVYLVFVSSWCRDLSRIKILRRHQQFQAELTRDLHFRYISTLFMFLVVVEVLHHLFQDHGVQVFEVADAGH